VSYGGTQAPGPGANYGDIHALYCGYDNDNVRYGSYTIPTQLSQYTVAIYPWDSTQIATAPHQDGVSVDYMSFGSAHPNSCNMAMCDGSVRAISYNIDGNTYGFLCSRKDGQIIQGSQY